MNEKITIGIGELVNTLSGHDAGQFFLVVRTEPGYVWLCDGKTRKATKCKRKNRKHIVGTGIVCDWVEQHPEQVNNTAVRRAIKELSEEYGR